MTALLFDLYGVLLTEQSDADIAAIEDAAGIAGPDFWRVYWDERPDYDAGLVSSAQYWERVGAALKRPIADLGATIEADLRSWAGHDPATVSYFRQLAASGVRLGVLSNIPRDIGAYIKATHPWLQLADPVLFSSDLGLAKPDKRIYERAIEAFKMPADEILFIDDRGANVAAAVNAGLCGHLYDGLAGLKIVVGAHLATTV